MRAICVSASLRSFEKPVGTIEIAVLALLATDQRCDERRCVDGVSTWILRV